MLWALLQVQVGCLLYEAVVNLAGRTTSSATMAIAGNTSRCKTGSIPLDWRKDPLPFEGETA